MYIDHFQLKQDPFISSADGKVFFTRGGRGTVLRHIINDINSNVPLVHLNGPDGSGRTTLCQQIHEEMRSKRTVVFWREPPNDFDEIGYRIFSVLDDERVAYKEEKDAYENTLHLLSNHASSESSILLIIDDAEVSNPSALKSLLSIISELKSKGTVVQLLLAGKQALAVDSELFDTICSEPLLQFTYTLQPLNRHDTALYIAYRLAQAGIPDEESGNIFKEKAIVKIYETSRGNIQFINVLAKDAMQNASKNKCSVVLADHVKTQTALLAGTKNVVPDSPGLFLMTRKWVLIFIGIVIIPLSFFGYKNSRSVSTGGGIHQAQTTAAILSPETITISSPHLNVTSPSVGSSPLKRQTIQPDLDLQRKTQERFPPVSQKERSGSKTESFKKKTGQSEIRSDTSSTQLSKELPPQEETSGSVLIMTPPVQGDNTEKEVSPVLNSIVESTQKGLSDKRNRLGDQAKTPIFISVEKNAKKRLSGYQIFTLRKRATAAWSSVGMRGKFTIQIMVTNTSKAKDKISYMLDDKVYRDLQKDIYILQNRSYPPTVFVYYGVYDSMKEARDARRKLPKKIKKNRPFPLVIASAIKKSK